MSGIVADVQARLQALDPPVFRLVEGAAGLAALTDAPLATPAAYVFTGPRAGGPNTRATGGHLQRVEHDIVVVIVTRNVGDSRGAAASLDAEAAMARTDAALVGWQPPSAEDVLSFVSSQPVRMQGGQVWLEVVYATATYLEG